MVAQPDADLLRTQRCYGHGVQSSAVAALVRIVQQR